LAHNQAVYPRVTYNRYPVRVAVLDSAPWWNTSDIFYLMNQRRLDHALLGKFGEEHVGLHQFDGEDAPEHVVSSIGAQTISSQLPWKLNIMVTGWLRKRHAVLTSPTGGDLQHVPLAMLADGSMPLRPSYAGAAFDEWRALEDKQRKDVKANLEAPIR
jgi:hypothetical protein